VWLVPGRGCALMGTVVHTGSGTGVAIASGGRGGVRANRSRAREAFNPETKFQVGLRKFSMIPGAAA
jgi:Mg2+-importing ATPase